MFSTLVALVIAAAPAQERTVYLVPLGKVEPRLLEVARAALEARVNATFMIAETRDLPEEAFYTPRQRYRAEKLITFLNSDAPDDSWHIVGITEAPISTTKGAIFDWGIAGLGDIGGRSCVLSSFLYKKHSRTRQAMERRFADVVVHEFGHTLGLDHCPVKGCVMADAKGKAIRSADESTGDYCKVCRERVELRTPGVLKPPHAPPLGDGRGEGQTTPSPPGRGPG
jgi:archaemetzincin